MKIVILEENAINNNDLCLDGLKALGEVVSYGVTPPEKIVEYIGDAEVVLCNKANITREVMLSCKNLKYIGECATGYNNIDIKASAELGITVTNAGQYSTMAVAQHVFAFIAEHFSKIGEYSSSVKNGDWIKSESFVYYLSPTEEIFGKTMGIIGFGSIGKAVAKIADAFGMKVLVSTRTVPEKDLYPYEFVERNELFSRSDIISLHCPLTDETKNIINKESLSLMKSTAFLINTSRGGTVVEKDLADALNNDKIGGAAVDVVATEPMLPDNPLLTAKNIIITPHIAWAPRQTRERLLSIVTENLRAWLDGKPKNKVN